MSDHREYETDNEEFWRINAWTRLKTRFELDDSDDQLALFHTFMAKRSDAWQIIRRHYGIYPLLSGTEDSKEGGDIPAIARDLGTTQAQVEREIAAAAEAWILAKARANLREELNASSSTLDALTRYSYADGLNDQQVEDLLKAYDFNLIKDPAFRLEIAGRLLSLSNYLTQPNTRTQARNVIRQEIRLHGLNNLQMSFQSKLEEELSKEVSAKNPETIQASIDNIEKQIADAAETHAKLLKAIGADEIDQTHAKKQFTGDILYLIESCRKYESDPANFKLDGIWTAEEIDWLLDPTAEGRDPQYRPDIAIRMADALRPENLWDPDYRPPKIARRITQELHQIVKHLRSVPEDAEPLPDILDDDDDAENIEITEPGMPEASADLEFAAIPAAPPPKKPLLGVFES